MPDDLPLFAQTGIPGQQWWWHLHARYLVRTTRGWPVELPHSEVWRYDDSCVAATVAEAESIFHERHGPTDPHHQWLRLQRGAEVEPEPPTRKKS